MNTLSSQIKEEAMQVVCIIVELHYAPAISTYSLVKYIPLDGISAVRINILILNHGNNRNWDTFANYDNTKERHYWSRLSKFSDKKR